MALVMVVVEGEQKHPGVWGLNPCCSHEMIQNKFWGMVNKNFWKFLLW
jgi:hypothetical protein